MRNRLKLYIKKTRGNFNLLFIVGRDGGKENIYLFIASRGEHLENIRKEETSVFGRYFILL